MGKWLSSLVLIIASAAAAAPREAVPIVFAKGLFAGSAMFEINGKSRLLREGKTSPEGVTLIEATPKYAKVEIAGEVKTLTLDRSVGSSYEPPPPPVIRIKPDENGHYTAMGRINNQWAEFLVDTGATKIAINSFMAEQLGIDYQGGVKVDIHTANGNVSGYLIELDHASIQGLRVDNPDALVIEGRFPHMILLGNSYLSQVSMQIEDGIMILQQN